MQQTEDDGYILARTAAEYDRLLLQARIWQPVTERLLAGAGLQPGMRCLDAGCGPGEVMRLLGKAVGPDGHVTGLDLDARLGAHMLARLHQDCGPQFAFVAGDLTRGEAVPGAPFDLVFARLLLCHMTDPVGAVRALAGQVRPGGRLVLMDYDMSQPKVWPEDAGMMRARQLIVDCFDRAGRHSDAGFRLADYLRSANLPPPDGSEVEAIYGSIRARGPMIRGVLGSLAGTAQTLGIATAEEIAELQAHISDLEAENRHFTLTPMMIGVWTTIGDSA